MEGLLNLSLDIVDLKFNCQMSLCRIADCRLLAHNLYALIGAIPDMVKILLLFGQRLLNVLILRSSLFALFHGFHKEDAYIDKYHIY